MTHNKLADNQKGSSMPTGFAGDTQKQPGERQPGVKQSGGRQSDEHTDRQMESSKATDRQ